MPVKECDVIDWHQYVGAPANDSKPENCPLCGEPMVYTTVLTVKVGNVPRKAHASCCLLKP